MCIDPFNKYRIRNFDPMTSIVYGLNKTETINGNEKNSKGKLKRI